MKKSIGNSSLARDILGKCFISPNEVEKARNVSYSPNQLRLLEKTFPSKEEIKKLKKTNMILLPNPPNKMSFLGVRDLDSDLFYFTTGGWYSSEREREAFSASDMTHFGWIAIFKHEFLNYPTPNRCNKDKILPEEMRIPNVAEMAWAITTYHAIRYITLFSQAWIRTSSTDSEGNHIFIGSYIDGLHICNCWDERNPDALAWPLLKNLKTD